MNLKFESKFEKDLHTIEDKNILAKLKDVIVQCKLAENINSIKNIKKLQGYSSFYRIRIGEYRIGLELLNNELIFTRFLHRKKIYRYFP